MYRGSKGWLPLQIRECGKVLLGVAVLMTAVTASYAGEGGASVYPAGVETIMPGRAPRDGGSMFLQFNNFYEANKLVGSDGKELLPGFHLRASAVAFKFVHNWGVHILGGSLVNSVAVPIVDLHLTAPFGRGNKVGVANPNLETAVAYHRGALYWWYGVEVYTPGFSYNKADLINVGQHNYATAPAAAITYMPQGGKTEFSSKVQYITNYSNNTTRYRSGSEFVWEYAAMRNVTKSVAVGGNGFLHQQATDDLVDGSRFLDGNRGNAFAFGPEIRCHFHHYSMILKYQKDLTAANRPVGNAFWLQIGVPIGARSHE